jgi:hypothetical protein
MPLKTDNQTAPSVRIGSPAALLVIVPHLLGFAPDNSLVVIGTKGLRSRVEVALRYDLPDPPDACQGTQIAEHAVDLLCLNDIDTAVVIGYGRKRQVTPLADAITAAAPPAGIWLADVLRVRNGRYWSCLCPGEDCCPPEGTPFEAKSHPAAAAIAVNGVKVLDRRADLVESLAPVDGEARQSMRQATDEAARHAAELVRTARQPGTPGAGWEAFATAGRDAIDEAIGLYRDGQWFESDDQIAWLSVALQNLWVRDAAWSRMDPAHATAHLRLWTDLTRRAQPGYAAAPASLLAFVAWQGGNGALANVALDRALADRPGYSMGTLLREALDGGLPPSTATLPMTPEQVDNAYRHDTGDPEASGAAEDAPGDVYGDQPVEV